MCTSLYLLVRAPEPVEYSDGRATIAVMGGAGYIGSNLVRAFLPLSDKYRIVIFDNLSTGHRASIPEWVHFINGDVRNPTDLDLLFETFDVNTVIHLCADSLVGESCEEPLKYYDNNVIGAVRLLQAMVRHDVRRVVFSSTAAIFGQPEAIPIREDDRKQPTNPYGATKLAIEQMLRWVDEAHGVKFVALRYFNAAGATRVGDNDWVGEAHNHETHLIPNVLRTLLPGATVTQVSVYGDDWPTRDGTCVRDYIDVRDLADAHIRAVRFLNGEPDLALPHNTTYDSPAICGRSEHLNLGNSEGFTVFEIIETARNVTGKQPEVKIADRRAGDPAVLIAASARATEVLGWVPHITIAEMVEAAWGWHSSHPHCYQDVRALV
jgi:UDP-glucose 4-epimerase